MRKLLIRFLLFLVKQLSENVQNNNLLSEIIETKLLPVNSPYRELQEVNTDIEETEKENAEPTLAEKLKLERPEKIKEVLKSALETTYLACKNANDIGKDNICTNIRKVIIEKYLEDLKKNGFSADFVNKDHDKFGDTYSINITW